MEGKGEIAGQLDSFLAGETPPPPLLGNAPPPLIAPSTFGNTFLILCACNFGLAKPLWVLSQLAHDQKRLNIRATDKF